MKTFNDLEDIEQLEKLDQEIKERTRSFDITSLITMILFVSSMILGITTYGWITLILGIFSSVFALNLCMNIHLVIQQKNTYIQIQENSEKLRNFMIENLKK